MATDHRHAFSGPGPWVSAEGVGYAVGGTHLVRDISLGLDPGSVVALVGPNGAGKSTFLALVSGDLEATTGAITVGGRAPRDWRAADIARHRAVMSQRQEASFAFTVEELVTMGRIPQRASDRDAEIVERSMADGDVLHLRQRETTTLSGGELARAGFARALAQTTELVLLDEPTAALDLRHQERVMQVSGELAREGHCVVVVLHDLNLAARHADRVAMFSRGALVADGAPVDVLTAERIEEVYGQPVQLLEHPVTGGPLVVPV